MRFFKLAFRLSSPAIVTERRTATGFKSPLRYVPGTMLRGALLSALFRQGLLSKGYVKREAEKPALTASPAYPLLGGKASFPCHPFAYVCKVSHGNKYEAVNYASEVLPELEQGVPLSLKVLCTLGHAALESPHPRPVVPTGKGIKEVEPRYHTSVCVGVSKHRGVAERGMLFDYEALAAGQKFWALVALPDELVGNFDKNFEFSVGRGVSRGFGRAEVIGLEEMSLREETKRVKASIKNGRVVLFALSPLLSSEDRICASFPKSIDLSKVAKRCGFEGRGSLKVMAVFGKVKPYIAGWDMVRNEERPTLPSVSQGSVAVAKVSQDFNAEALAALGLAGTVESALGFALSCVNILTPLRGHPMEGRE